LKGVAKSKLILNKTAVPSAD